VSPIHSEAIRLEHSSRGFPIHRPHSRRRLSTRRLVCWDSFGEIPRDRQSESKGSRCAEDSLHGLRSLQICLPARLLAWQLPGSRYPPRTPGSRRLHCGALSRHAILWQLTCRPRYGGSARKRNGRGWICSTSVTIWFDIGSMLQPAAIRGNRKRKRSRFSETGRRRDSGLAQASARLYSAMSLPQACSAAGRS